MDLIDGTEEASIYFDLSTGKRAHFSGVEISSPQPLTDEQRSSLIRATEWHRGISFLPLPGWRSVTENRVQVGLENLRRQLQKNDRLQARVTLDRLDYNARTNGATALLTIDNGPIIEVRATGGGQRSYPGRLLLGKEKIGRTRLRQLVPIYQERTVDRALLLEGQRNLTEYMQSGGLLRRGRQLHRVHAFPRTFPDRVHHRPRYPA